VAISPGKTIDDLYRERVPLYERYADLAVHCRKQFPEQVAKQIIQSMPKDRT
jgi:shikimate kinase